MAASTRAAFAEGSSEPAGDAADGASDLVADGATDAVGAVGASPDEAGVSDGAPDATVDIASVAPGGREQATATNAAAPRTKPAHRCLTPPCSHAAEQPRRRDPPRLSRPRRSMSLLG